MISESILLLTKESNARCFAPFIRNVYVNGAYINKTVLHGVSITSIRGGYFGQSLLFQGHVVYTIHCSSYTTQQFWSTNVKTLVFFPERPSFLVGFLGQRRGAQILYLGAPFSRDIEAWYHWGFLSSFGSDYYSKRTEWGVGSFHFARNETELDRVKLDLFSGSIVSKPWHLCTLSAKACLDSKSWPEDILVFLWTTQVLWRTRYFQTVLWAIQRRPLPWQLGLENLPITYINLQRPRCLLTNRASENCKRDLWVGMELHPSQRAYWAEDSCLWK